MKIVWMIQLLAELVSAVVIARVNVLPLKYLIALGGVMSLCLIITLLLIVVPAKNENSTGYKLRRTIAAVLALAISAASIFGCSVVSAAKNTMDAITTTPRVISSTVGVYVRADDPAETIADAKDYSFGKSLDYDTTGVKNMLSDIEHQLDTLVQLREFETVFFMVDMLYSGEIDAMVLDVSLADLIAEVDGYNNFEERVKLIAEQTYTIQEEEDSFIKTAIETHAVKNISYNPFVVYLSGSDTRSTMLNTSRSDVNILAVVNPKTREVLLLNTPRDYYVPISVSSTGPGIN